MPRKITIPIHTVLLVNFLEPNFGMWSALEQVNSVKCLADQHRDESCKIMSSGNL